MRLIFVIPLFAALERKTPGDEPGAGSVQQGMKLIQDSI